METSLKIGFAQIFSCCPKKLSCPKFGGATAPLVPPARTPMLVTSIWQGPGPVATKMPFFRRNSSLLQRFSAPTQEGNRLFLSKRSDRKKLCNFPIKLNDLCRTSRHVWLSSRTCDRCCAYQLICGMTISTCMTGARAHFFRVQDPGLVNVSFPPLHSSCKC